MQVTFFGETSRLGETPSWSGEPLAVLSTQASSKLSESLPFGKNHNGSGITHVEFLRG
jgi:hypothetical protein